MAIKVQPVVEDVGSEVLELLRKEWNKMLDEADAAADFAAFKLALQTSSLKLMTRPELPARRKEPVEG